jgi:hypothetical protein
MDGKCGLHRKVERCIHGFSQRKCLKQARQVHEKKMHVDWSQLTAVHMVMYRKELLNSTSKHLTAMEKSSCVKSVGIFKSELSYPCSHTHSRN